MTTEMVLIGFIVIVHFTGVILYFIEDGDRMLYAVQWIDMILGKFAMIILYLKFIGFIVSLIK